MTEPVEKTVRRRTALPRAIVATCLVMIVLLAGLFAATRYGVLVPQARLLIEARTDGLKLGRVGRLRIEGLSGDVWRDFRIRRLTIRDEEGVWLEANNAHIIWGYGELLKRRFDARQVEAESLRLIRRPTLEPKTVDRGLPVSFHIDAIRARLILEPAFSHQRGVFDLTGRLDAERRGDRVVRLTALSVLHPGDRGDLDLALGPTRPLRLSISAMEAQGGALAGSMGLSPDRPFSLQVRADGTPSEGRFTALAHSGEAVPIWARGAWNPQGGDAGGTIALAASRLTAPYARRLGARVVFGVAGRRAPGGFQALEARVRSDNLAVRVSGQGNLVERRLGPRGLALDARAAQLSRLVGGPQAGAARIEGVLTGTPDDWRFSGTSAVSDLKLGGYGLTRISGPLTAERARGTLTLTGKLAGAGGRGDGYLAAILGGAPTAAFEGARTADGRLALRRLTANGRGLKVEASGGRSLLGALTFKGRADIANLEAVGAGAAGGANLTWSASQARAGRPWSFTVDGRGERLATGMAELDRLLGASPRLRAQANWGRGRVQVAEASLEGAALRASGGGVLSANGGLAFKADWSASGPFRAGPVEISGKARGDGALTGTLATPRLDLVAEAEAIDVPRLPLKNARITVSFLRRPDGSSGLVAANADSAYGPARGRAAFRFPEGGMDLTDLSVDAGGLKASGAVALRRRTPSSADLTVDLTPGAFLAAGHIWGTAQVADRREGPYATLNLRGEDFRLPGTTLPVRAAVVAARGPVDRLTYEATAEGASLRGPWRANLSGDLAQEGVDRVLTALGTGTVGKYELRSVEPTVLRFGPQGRSARGRFRTGGGGELAFDGTLRDGAADIDVTVAALGLELIDPDLLGSVAGTIHLQGRGTALQGTAQARLADARGRGAPREQGLDGTVQARLTDGALTLRGQVGNAQGLKADADLTLPAVTSAAPFRIAIVRQRPMRGRFFAEGEVQPLWDLLFGGERTLAGHVRTEGLLSGTFADPNAEGNIVVDRGRFDDGGTGLSLRDVALRADFARNAIDVTQAAGSDGHGGAVSGSGRISLLREGASSFRLDLRGFRLIDNDLATGSASGPVTIARAADGKVRLSGELSVDRADVAAKPPVPSGVAPMDVIEVNRPGSLPDALPASRRRGDGWLLDVKLAAPRRVFLRGRGLDVELSVDAHVGGTSSRPELSGAARVVRGDYDFAGKRFEFDTASVVYLARESRNVRLQLDAVRDDPSLRVVVQIRGTAERPEVTLVSVPSLPNDEVLSQVLFGRSAAQLTPVEAAQLASALSSMAGGGGLDVIGNLRAFARLDRLAFAGGDESGVSVSGGKYITDDVYLEVTGGGREGPSAQVEWRVRRTLSIISRFAGQGGNRLAVRWRREY